MGGCDPVGDASAVIPSSELVSVLPLADLTLGETVGEQRERPQIRPTQQPIADALTHLVAAARYAP